MTIMTKEEHREYWDQLIALSEENKVKEFYTLYVEYLERCNIYSSNRKALHKMAKAVATHGVEAY